MAWTSTATAPTNRGMAIGENPVQNLVLTFPAAASASLAKGDFVTMDDDGYVSKNTTNEAVIHGVAMAPCDNSSGSAGDKYVAVCVKGIVEVDALVMDTDGSSGYDHAIVVGEIVYVGGDAGTTAADGQAAVSGQGTNGVTSNPLGIALDACDGVTTGNTLYLCRVYIDTFVGSFVGWNT